MALAKRTVYLTDGTVRDDVQCDIEAGGVWIVEQHEDLSNVWRFYPMHRIELVVRRNP